MEIEKNKNGHYIAEVYIPVKRWLTNNVCVKELCCLCKTMFNAESLDLYEIEGFGYLCYDCVNNLKVKQSHLDEIKIKEIQDSINGIP